VFPGALEDLGPRLRVFVAAAGDALGLVERGANGLQVGQYQLSINRFDIANRIDGAFDVCNVVAFEAADDVQNRVDLADVREEFVAQTVAGAGAADDAGDVDDAHLRVDDLLSLDELVDDLQPRV